MNRSGLPALVILAAASLATPATAQHAAGGHVQDHTGHTAHAATAPASIPLEAGQGAFAAIAEIVAMLDADPQTDWSKVDIPALRQHLVDMSNVTLRARVTARDIPGGARFEVSGPADVAASLRRMAFAHAAMMDGVDGMHFAVSKGEGGIVMAVTSADGDPARIRALGFVGLMATGMHHQAHHLAMATGRSPH